MESEAVNPRRAVVVGVIGLVSAYGLLLEATRWDSANVIQHALRVTIAVYGAFLVSAFVRRRFFRKWMAYSWIVPQVGLIALEHAKPRAILVERPNFLSASLLQESTFALKYEFEPGSSIVLGVFVGALVLLILFVCLLEKSASEKQSQADRTLGAL